MNEYRTSQFLRLTMKQQKVVNKISNLSARVDELEAQHESLDGKIKGDFGEASAEVNSFIESETKYIMNKAAEVLKEVKTQVRKIQQAGNIVSQ